MKCLIINGIDLQSTDEFAVPGIHLARFTADVSEQLDLSAIYAGYGHKDGRGQLGYHPPLLTRLLLYGYCVGVVSSRADGIKRRETMAEAPKIPPVASDFALVCNVRISAGAPVRS